MEIMVDGQLQHAALFIRNLEISINVDDSYLMAGFVLGDISSVPITKVEISGQNCYINGTIDVPLEPAVGTHDRGFILNQLIIQEKAKTYQQSVDFHFVPVNLHVKNEGVMQEMPYQMQIERDCSVQNIVCVIPNCIKADQERQKWFQEAQRLCLPGKYIPCLREV